MVRISFRWIATAAVVLLLVLATTVMQGEPALQVGFQGVPDASPEAEAPFTVEEEGLTSEAGDAAPAAEEAEPSSATLADRDTGERFPAITPIHTGHISGLEGLPGHGPPEPLTDLAVTRTAEATFTTGGSPLSGLAPTGQLARINFGSASGVGGDGDDDGDEAGPALREAFRKVALPREGLPPVTLPASEDDLPATGGAKAAPLPTAVWAGVALLGTLAFRRRRQTQAHV